MNTNKPKHGNTSSSVDDRLELKKPDGNKDQKPKGKGKEFEKSSSPSKGRDHQDGKKELGDDTQIDDETTI